MALGIPGTPRWADGSHAGPAQAFHSGTCGKLARQLPPSPTRGAPCASASCSRSPPTMAPLAGPKRSPPSRNRPSGLKTSACCSQMAKRCLPPSNVGSSRLKPTPGLAGTDAAKRAEHAGAATAATPSCSGPCMATCRSPARGCTAARAGMARGQPPCRRCATSSPATSRRSGCTWRHAGRRSCLTPQRPTCSPMSCRSHRARTPPRFASTSCGWPSGPKANSGRNSSASSTAARQSGPGCRSRRGASSSALMAATSGTGTTGGPTSS